MQFELTSDQQRGAANPAHAVFDSRRQSALESDCNSSNCRSKQPKGPARFPIEVRVSVPSSVVAAVHSLPRGAIVHADDLTLAHADPSGGGENVAFHAIEEVVGKQTTKAIAEGKVMTPDALQSPLLVRRGDVVTVYARDGGHPHPHDRSGERRRRDRVISWRSSRSPTVSRSPPASAARGKPKYSPKLRRPNSVQKNG